MHARLFIPPASKPPLLIWFHSGGFHRGSTDHADHDQIAQEFAKFRIATAFVEYRLQTPIEALSRQSQQLMPMLRADAETNDFGLNDFLTGPGAIGALESSVMFFKWLEQVGPKHGLTGPIMLGGSSAGAITVLNTLSLAPHLGIKLPPIQSAFVMSGAFAYPSFFTPRATPILAQHRPTDTKVPIQSIRAYARQSGPICTLIERDRIPHGGLKFYPKEQLSVAVARMVSFAQGNGVPGYESDWIC